MTLQKSNAAKFIAFVVGCFAFACTEEDQKFTYSPVITGPIDGSANQSLEVMLQWDGANKSEEGEAYTFDIYLGTSEDNLQPLGSVVYQGEFKCSALALNTTYFWKVIAKANGRSKESAISKFVTIDKLPQVEVGSKTLMFFPGDYLGVASSIPGVYRTESAGAFSWDDGKQNTEAIRNYYGEETSRGWGAAAEHCDKLNAYGYSDWYLPSIHEIDAVVTENNLVKFNTDVYWSSTELDVDTHRDAALTKSTTFYPGLDYSVADKTATHIIKCRCVRHN